MTNCWFEPTNYVLEYLLLFKTTANHPRDSNDSSTCNDSSFHAVRLELKSVTSDNLILSYSIPHSHTHISSRTTHLRRSTSVYLLICIYYTHFDRYLTMFYIFVELLHEPRLERIYLCIFKPLVAQIKHIWSLDSDMHN